MDKKTLVKKVANKVKEADLAFTRDKAMETLDSLQMNIAIHLILLFSFPRSDEASGWKRELNAWRTDLVRKNRGKGGAKNYKPKVLENGLWEEPLGEPGDRAARLKEIQNDKGIEVPSIESKLSAFKKFTFKFIDSVLMDTKF